MNNNLLFISIHIPRILRKTALSLLSFLILLMVSSLSLSAESWRLHPAFDSTPIRIVDTPEYTFFQVFQKYYTDNQVTYTTPITAGLISFRGDPARAIIPISDWAPVNGTAVGACEYSPEGRFLALLYTDGSLDLVSDSGEVINNAALRNCLFPGFDIVKSMTVSGTQIWIATGGGYMVVDGLTGHTLALRNLNREVSRIARCGERILLLCDNTLYDFKGEGFPSSLENVERLTVTPGNPQLFLPLSGTRCLYIGNKVSTGTYSLNVASMENGEWHTSHVADVWLPTVSAQTVINNVFEKNFIRNKAGWLMFTGGDVRQISYTADADSPDFVTGIGTFRADAPEASRDISIFGSWDMTSGWTYCDRGRFAAAVAEGGRFLVDDQNAVRPNLPAAAHSTSLAFSPLHGTIGVAYGASWIFNNIAAVLPSLMSVYDGNKWTLTSAEYNKPRSAETNPDLEHLYNTFPAYFPVGCLKGVSVDPLDPDYAWLGSLYGGMAAVSLSDPKADPLHFGTPDDPLASFPGFKAVLPSQASWYRYCALLAPTFDSDSTLWTFNHDLDAQVAGESPAKLLYWRAAERKKVLASRDVSDAAFSGSVSLPLSHATAHSLCLALRHDRSRNLVLAWVAGNENGIYRLNHHGDPGRASDNQIDVIHYIDDKRSGRVKFHPTFFAMAEDPVSGRVWVAHWNGLLSFDPTSEVVENAIKGEAFYIGEGEYAGNPFSQVQVYGIAFDDDNRMWLVTNNYGVWCISPDRTKVEARYTSQNSRLPSDTAYGLVWNPTTKTMMISTDYGYAELSPDLSSFSAPIASNVSVAPREVMPGYAGKVTLRGAEGGETIKIIAPDGSLCAAMKCNADGILIWDMKDSRGERVAPGIYTLSGKFGNVEVAVVR